MESKVEKKTFVTLVLSEWEAKWLKMYMQNPHCDPKDESEEDSRMREAFFDAIVRAV